MQNEPDFIGQKSPEKFFKKLLRVKTVLIVCSSFAAEATEDWKTKTKVDSRSERDKISALKTRI
jgi:hypothetical protein